MSGAERKINIRFIDFLKALLILGVITAHTNFANESFKPWVTVIAMPAFFFSSGMLMKDRTFPDMQSAGALLWKKFQSLMFPYFLWALIFASLEGANLIRILYGSYQALVDAGTLTSLWFLPTLFVATAMFLLAQLVFGNHLKLPLKLLLTVLTFGVGVLLPERSYGYPWCCNLAFTALGFLLLGNIAFPVIMRFRKAVNTEKRCVWLCALFALFGFAGTLLYRFNIPKDGFIHMARAHYGSFPMFLLTGCMGIVFSVAVSILLERILPAESRVSRALSFLGQNTLCVFATQKPIIKVFGTVFKRIPTPDALALLVTCIGTAFGCCLIAVFLNRYLPTMLGKIPPKPEQ